MFEGEIYIGGNVYDILYKGGKFASRTINPASLELFSSMVQAYLEGLRSEYAGRGPEWEQFAEDQAGVFALRLLSWQVGRVRIINCSDGMRRLLSP